MTTIADVLDRAADVIERNGWHQGAPYDPDSDLEPAACPVCALGAIRLAASGSTITEGGESDPALPAWSAMEDFLGRALTDWNDDFDRTAAEVVETLRGAAAAERGRAA